LQHAPRFDAKGGSGESRKPLTVLAKTRVG